MATVLVCGREERIYESWNLNLGNFETAGVLTVDLSGEFEEFWGPPYVAPSMMDVHFKITVSLIFYA